MSITRRISIAAATGALAVALAAPAQADPPGDWRLGGEDVTAVTASVRPDDRAHRTGPPVGAAVVAGTPSDRDAGIEGSDVLWLGLFVGAFGLLALAMVYSSRRFRNA